MCNSTILQAPRRTDPQTFVGTLRSREGCIHFPSMTHNTPLKSFNSNKVQYNEEGLTALIFTSEGDMRQAINNLQSTHSGFGFVSGDNVFKVCDQPHPLIVQTMLRHCVKGNIEDALDKLKELWEAGYSAVDIIVTVFRVTKVFDE